MEIIERLQTISLFSEIKNNSAALEKVAATIKVEKFAPNTYIIREGETGDKMYILNKGTVRIEKSTLDKDTFTLVNLRDTMNVFFGEVALMDSDVRSASIITLVPTECYVIKKSDFDKLCESHPEIGYYIVKEVAILLSGRLRKTTQDNVNLIGALVSDDFN